MQSVFTNPVPTPQRRPRTNLRARAVRRTASGLIAATLLCIAGAAQAQDSLTGVLTARWGDGGPDAPTASRFIYSLATFGGQDIDVEFSNEQLRAAGGRVNLNGSSVTLTLVPEFLDRDFLDDNIRRVAELETVEPGAPALDQVTRGGATSSVWVTLPCRFSDDASEQRDQAFFAAQYGTTAPELDHFWRYSSYDQLNLIGSSAQNWVSLPSPRSTYVPADADCFNITANLGLLFNECVAVHDPMVNFSQVVGINMMFNDSLDGCAWGGSRFATLDGVSRTFRVTWNPPFSFQNTRVLQHEMGHGFGMPHSNNWDDDGWPYDSAWDVMSGGSASSDPVYGTIGTDTIAYHKDIVGWLTPAVVQEITSGTQTVTIDPLNLATTSNLRMVRIPIPDTNRYYTVEARDTVGTYDEGVPDNAILIHEVDTVRREDAWLYDEAVPPSDDSRNEGSKWLVGETFADTAIGLTIEILSSTVDGGFEVRVSFGDDSIFTDGFESGDVSSWDD